MRRSRSDSPRRVPFSVASTAIAISLLVSAHPSNAAAPANPTPPLGILIAPADPPPPPVVNSPPASEEPRPLGILLGPGPVPPAVAPAIPTGVLSSPTPAPGEPNIHQPALSGNTQRPLGVLIEKAPEYVAPAAIVAPPPSAAPTATAPATVSASPPAIVPTLGGSTDRPLGILISPTTTSAQPVPAARTAATPSIAEPAAGTPTLGTASQDDLPVRFVANEMTFDRENGIITASGNVEVGYGDRRLVADRIIYDQNKDVATATGNVTLHEPTGERLFGDRMEVSGDLKDAVIRNIGMLLKDRSRVAGVGARHSSGQVTELRKGVYSPCSLCKDDPSRPPLWQIKAVKVVHDKSQKTVEYRDAWLEFFGYPVAYTPYFRHPDPTVKRKSGFLFPKIGSSSDFGTVIETPYFWAISDHEDATIRPIVMTSEAPVLALQYRKRQLNGEIELDSSITDNSDGGFSTETGEHGIRGHIDGKARFNINRTWRWGIDAQRASDDTYMRRYGFGSLPSLNSQLFVEGFRQDNYFSAKTLMFQGLQDTDDQDTSPIVLPLVDYNYAGRPGRFGGRFMFDFNFMALTRARGTDTRRISLRPRWERVFQGPIGDLYRFETAINTDLYHVNSLERSGDQEQYSGAAYRVFPYANVEWRLPMVKTQGSIRQVLEPIASITVAPNGGNSDKIPNEDSTDFEFDESNLFAVNRFSGLDRVEGGARLNYGLKWGVFGAEGGSTTAFIGQAYRPRTDSTFGSGSGLEDNLSDIIASMSMSPSSYLKFLYRTRFSADNFSPNRNEVDFNVGVPAFKLSGRYTFLEQQEGSEFAGREEMDISANSKINRYWRASLSAVRDISSSEMRSVALSTTYEDECFELTSRLTRTFFEDRDLKPTDAITFYLVLKTLGEVKSGASISSN